MDSGQTFILVIVLAAIGAGVVKHYMRLKETQPRENPDYQKRIDTLERRVQTLERIVTEKGYDLKGEFDRL